MYKIGVDVGGTNIACGVVDENYKIIGRSNIKTVKERSGEAVVNDMLTAAKTAACNAGLSLDDIDYCGFGIPGWVDNEQGKVIETTNLNLSGVYLVGLAEKELNIKCGLQNDANAAVYGEYIAGAGKGTKDFVAITLGTGVGGGIIINGHIYSGANGAGGELGHTVIVHNGEPCACGRKGCFEAYASVSALVRQTVSAMEKDKSSIMWSLCGGDISKVNGRTSFDAMRKGDITAKAVVDKYIEYISVGVVDIINIFQPEILCIGGGISKEGDNIIVPLREIAEKYRYSGNTNKQTEIKAAMLGNDAGIIGAAFAGEIN